MRLSGNGHQSPVLIEVRLRALWLRIDCSGGHEEAGHQWGELGEILELPQMKELPKRILAWRNVGRRVHCVGAYFDSQRKGNPYRYVFLDTASTLRGRAIE